jgi:hypothetical protein
MKAKIAIAVSALLIGAISPAKADVYIASPFGLTQAQWNAMDEYKNFTCPDGYSRGEGVDSNYTATRADDFWFISCTPNVINEPKIIWDTTQIIPVTPPSETSTVSAGSSVISAGSSVTAPINNDTATVVSETKTVVTETATATSKSTTFESLYAQVMALLTQILALIAKLNG